MGAEPAGVGITVEWAHWGKAATDAEYNLLRCSSGTLSAHDFEQVLSRYSPGTLGFTDLPQVTINWLSKDRNDQQGGKDYVGLAIYYDAKEGRVDISGRNVMFTDYFCVPFEQIAAHSVSYMSLYETVRRSRIQHAPEQPIEYQLAPAPPPALPSDVHNLAMRAAQLLLTDDPVCVLNAEFLKLTERIELLDLIASYLPYGMRGRLSAGTWVSSTFRKHLLRLFFASADRGTGDNLVTLGHVDFAPLGNALADRYLDRLAGHGLTPEMLKEYKEVTGFKLPDVNRAFLRLAKNPPRPRAALESARPAATHPNDPAPPAQDSRSRETIEQPANEISHSQPDRHFESPVVQFGGEPQHVQVSRNSAALTEILTSCELALGDGDQRLLSYGVDQLNRFRATQHGVSRTQIREAIEHRRLLRPGAAIESDLLRPFYAGLLGLAYTDGGAFRYKGFRFVLDQVAGYSLSSVHALAMIDAGLEGPARLLLANMFYGSSDGNILSRVSISPADTVAMIVDKDGEITGADVDAVLNAALLNLRANAKVSDAERVKFVENMQVQQLIAVLQRRYAARPQQLLATLTEILIFVYREDFTANDAKAVFGKLAQPPSAALVGAMFSIAHPKYHASITRLFALYAVRRAGLDALATSQLEKAILRSRRRPVAAVTPESIPSARTFWLDNLVERWGIRLLFGGVVLLIVVVVFAFRHLLSLH